MNNYWRMLITFTVGFVCAWLLLERLTQNDYPYTPPACEEGEVFSEEEGCQQQTGFVLTVINN